MNAHTPTPWAVTRFADGTIGLHSLAREARGEAWNELATFRGSRGEENSAFIVTACNAHDELIVAIHKLRYAVNRRSNEQEALDESRAALTKAGAA